MDNAACDREQRRQAVLGIAMAEFERQMSAPVTRLAKAISDDLEQAIAYYETFAPSGSDPVLIRRVNAAGVNFGFNVISESLQLGCILALCRLWDKPKDSAHIPAMARELQRDTELLCDSESLQKWLDDEKAIESSDELKALREFRHVGLAHRADPNRPDPRAKRGARRVVHGDERVVLERTIDLVDQLNWLICYPRQTFRDLRIECRGWSRSFWDRVAT